MSGRVAYLDASTFVKLVVAAPESAALRRFLRAWPWRASAAVLRAEAVRTLEAFGQQQAAAARQLFGGLHLIALNDVLLDRAGELRPEQVGPLHAIHVAAALSLGSELGPFVTYDPALAAAAAAQGLDVAAPS
jgi:predicted nucleic acid-binding protein